MHCSNDEGAKILEKVQSVRVIKKILDSRTSRINSSRREADAARDLKHFAYISLRQERKIFALQLGGFNNFVCIRDGILSTGGM